MIRKITVATLLTYSVFGHGAKHIEQGKKIVIEAGQSYQTLMKSLQEKGQDVLGVDLKANMIDAVVDSDFLKELKSRNVKFKALDELNIKAKLDERYLNPTEVESFLKNINKRYPTLTKLINVGNSYEGRPIWAIKISDDASIDDPKEPSVLFNGMHHAREIMTPEVTTDIVKYLVENYKVNSQVKKWVDNNEIYVLPMLNVDGNTKVWEGSKMWRKNTRGGYGVDINRNYPTNWNACGGSSGWRSSQQYRGSEAASEPETNVLMNFVSAIKPVFNISYHAYSELVIYPYGCKGQRTANRDVVEGIGKELGRVLNYVPGTSWETLYSVDGSDIDWMYQEEQVIPYVIEVSPRSDGFQPSYEKRDPTVEHNRQGWQLLLDRLDSSSIHGVSKNNKVINISKLDSNEFTAYQDYKINPDGSFHIILSPGTYKVEFDNDESTQRIIEVKDQRINL